MSGVACCHSPHAHVSVSYLRNWCPTGVNARNTDDAVYNGSLNQWLDGSLSPS